jgi:hypothetical protein
LTFEFQLSDYCREVEAYLCRKNDGHLIRIVGPSFDMVSRWAADGVPLNVVFAGVDRYFERYYRKGPRRRPVRIDFCEADVLDVFDEWRRATGVIGVGEDDTGAAAQPQARRGPSLREHVERVLIRMSSLQATGRLGPGLDPLIDQLSLELDAARASAGGLRGEARRAMLARLAALDGTLISLARQTADPEVLMTAQRDAADELEAFRERMPREAFAAALENATARLLRDRLGLPVISFGG